ncbi:unnamed protein product [Phytophthora fragariaefolia]|uniref:Unnamed protein product n=1 Tax=Phytophthora fragariaefolia TaxID=1490495 RepID=A0A9W7CT44_9STRA|nr:unnamed protein product [Phytophthora fragariaefolia]
MGTSEDSGAETSVVRCQARGTIANGDGDGDSPWLLGSSLPDCLGIPAVSSGILSWESPVSCALRDKSSRPQSIH